MNLGVVVALMAGISLLAALVANAEVQRRSVAKGDGLLLMWAKGGLAGAGAMIGIWAIYIVIGNVINVLT